MGSDTPGGELRVLVVLLKSTHNPLLEDLVDHLQPRGVKFTVVTLDRGGPLEDVLRNKGIVVHAIRAESALRIPKGVLALRRIIRKETPDVVHSHLFLPSLVAALVNGARPLVVTRHHNLLHHLERKRFHVALDSWSAKRSNRVVAVSEAVAKTLQDLEGVPSEKVEVIHNGIDIQRINKDPAAMERWRAQFEGRRLIVSAGRLATEKDHRTMLQVFKNVLRMVPDVSLAIAGTGTDRGVEKVRGLVESMNLEQHVTLLGHVSDINSLIAAADVFLQTSIDEAFSLTILEALLLETPIVTTTPGGTPEAVAPFYPHIEVGDVGTLTEAVMSRLNHEAEAHLVATQAGAATRDRFGIAPMADRYLSLYQRVGRAT